MGLRVCLNDAAHGAGGNASLASSRARQRPLPTRPPTRPPSRPPARPPPCAENLFEDVDPDAVLEKKEGEDGAPAEWLVQLPGEEVSACVWGGWVGVSACGGGGRGVHAGCECVRAYGGECVRLRGRPPRTLPPTPAAHLGACMRSQGHPPTHSPPPHTHTPPPPPHPCSPPGCPPSGCLRRWLMTSRQG